MLRSMYTQILHVCPATTYELYMEAHPTRGRNARKVPAKDVGVRCPTKYRIDRTMLLSEPPLQLCNTSQYLQQSSSLALCPQKAAGRRRVRR